MLLARRAGGGGTEESTAERAQTGRKKRRKSQFVVQQTSNITSPGLVSERSTAHAPLKACRRGGIGEQQLQKWMFRG